VWGEVYEMLVALPKRDAKALLRLISNSDKPVVSERKAKELISKCQNLFEARLSRKHKRRKLKEEATAKWIHDVLKKSKSQDEIKQDIGDIPDFEKLLDQVYTGGLTRRNKAMCVLASAHGISARTICKILNISRGSVRRYLKDFEVGGVKQLNARQCKVPRKSDNECIRRTVLATLHEPPSAYGINRTSWKHDDLLSVLATKGTKISCGVLAEILKKEGFKWKAARVVLTSKDPEYREKLTNIQEILGALKDDEAFFSIDEYGPFSVKMKGGRKLVAPGEEFTIPQWQRSRGKLIMTAALELSSNQVTHFYSEKKNTDEMIKMADLLVDAYRDRSKIWLSWDAASWHISKKLNEHIESINEKAALNGGPVLATAPLPAGAQFLNVIESVFSGLARNVIHHSDYRSADEAKRAIDKYFESRNAHFLHNPKRAGKKIWGKERVVSRFDDANNCKDPRYR
jgi:transposase